MCVGKFGLFFRRSSSDDAETFRASSSVSRATESSRVIVKKTAILLRWWKTIWLYKPITVSIMVFVIPCLLFIFFDFHDPRVRTAYVVLVVTSFWVTEGIPICATAFLPVVLFPFFRVVHASTLVTCYMSSAVMLYLGTMLVGGAICETHLDRRMALWMLSMCGSQIQNVMLGFMLCGWMLSMWISNTATTSMLLPILGELLNELQRCVNILDREHHHPHQISMEAEPTCRRDEKEQPSDIEPFVADRIISKTSISEVTTSCLPHAPRLPLHHHHFVPQRPVDTSSNINPVSASVVSNEEREKDSDGSSSQPAFVIQQVATHDGLETQNDQSSMQRNFPIITETNSILSPPHNSIFSTSSPANSFMGEWYEGSAKGTVSASAFGEACVPLDDAKDVVEKPLENLIPSESVLHDGSSEQNCKVSTNGGLSMYQRNSMMYLALAYSCSIGGISTLTGTATNVVLVGQVDEVVGSENHLITFGKWMMFMLPVSAICLVLAWINMQVVWMGPRRTFLNICASIRCCFRFVRLCGRKCFRWMYRKGRQPQVCDDKTTRQTTAISFGREFDNCSRTFQIEERDKVSQLIEAKYQALGNVSFGEKLVFSQFALMLTLWLTRDPGFVPGWGAFFGNDYVVDDTVAVGIGLLSFILPKTNVWGDGGPSSVSFATKKEVSAGAGGEGGEVLPWKYPAILTWPSASQHIDWGIVILLGGGFALAKGVSISGLDTWLALQLSKVIHLPKYAMIFFMMCITSALTEFMSNLATATIMVPILMALAKTLNINMLKLCIPVVVAASFSFMLPMATPPNALVFQAGNLHIIDMIKSGVMLNLLCITVMFGALPLWGERIFSLNEPLLIPPSA